MKRGKFLALLGGLVVTPIIANKLFNAKTPKTDSYEFGNGKVFMIVEDRNGQYWIHKNPEIGWEEIKCDTVIPFYEA